MKKYLTVLLLIILVMSPALSVSAETTDDEKLRDMGFSNDEISEMDSIKKGVFLKVYDYYDGTARLIPTDEGEISLLDESQIQVYTIGGSVGSCMSGYKCKGLSVVGEIDKPWYEAGTLKAVLAGAAWSDDWNYIGYEAEVDYGDFWGNPVTAAMILTDAVPKTGLSFKYTAIPSHVNDIYTSVHVDLRRATGDSGTTDAVGKVGFSEEEIIASAFISAAPGVTFTPVDKIYQKASTSSFYY